MLRPRLAPLFLLLASLPAQRRLLDTLPQDAEANKLTGFGVAFEPLELAGEGTTRGIARIGKVVWLLRGSELLRLAWPSARVDYRVEAPPGLRGLCSDGRLLYSLGAAEIVVLDPIAGRPVGSRPIDADPMPTAIGWHLGALHVAVAGEVRRLGVTGEYPETRHLSSSAPVHWLASDGARLWAATGSELRLLDCANDAATWQGGRWPVSFAISAGTWIDGRLLLAAEYADPKQRSLQLVGLWSPIVEPSEKGLSMKVCRTAAGLSWRVGSRQPTSRVEMQAELRRMAVDRGGQAVQGQSNRSLPVVLEAGLGATVKDLADTWDAVVEAGFTGVSSPPQEAWARDRLAWARMGLQERRQ